MSPKKRKLAEIYSIWRMDFLTSVGYCEICGALPHEVHHIARGIHREKAETERCAVLALCNHCHHEEVGDWPIPRQLAALACSRPYDLNFTQFNIIRGRDAKDVGFLDILPYLEMKWEISQE